MIGIKRLAEHLNISIGTVSRALNGRPDVNEETRKRVLEAADELGYVANQSGRSLRQGNTNVIGFMIESGTETAGNADNFFLGVFDGVQNVLRPPPARSRRAALPRRRGPARISAAHGGARASSMRMIISATQRVDRAHRLAVQGAASPSSRSAARPRPATIPGSISISRAWPTAPIDRLVAQGHRRIAVGLPSNDINLGFVFLDGYQERARAPRDHLRSVAGHPRRVDRTGRLSDRPRAAGA